MIYLLYLYFGLNVFFVGRYWEEFFIYKPSLEQKIRIFITIFLGCLFASLVVLSAETLDFIRNNPFKVFLRKSHLQIGTTCYVWGGGLYNKSNKEFIELSKFKSDKRFIVKDYKFISTIDDAVS
jgi:hypothetical protein